MSLKLLSKSSLVLLLCVSSTVLAQDVQEAAQDQKNDAEKEDKIVADSAKSEQLDAFFSSDNPTFSLLGVKNSDVQNPTTPVDLAAGILNGLDQNGNLQQGFAIEFNPTTLFNGDGETAQKYWSRGWLGRSLSNINVGIGAARGLNDNDRALRLATGFTWKPINGLDPLKRTRQFVCRHNVFNEAETNYPGSKDFAIDTMNSQKRSEFRAREYAKCDDKFNRNEDNTTTLEISAAAIYASESGAFSDLSLNGYSINSNLSIGLGKKVNDNIDANGKLKKIDWRKANDKSGRLILSAGYRDGELLPDPNNEGQFIDRNRFYAGGRLSYGVRVRYRLGLEAVYQTSNYSNNLSDDFTTIIGSVDYRISDDIWLQLSLGGSTGNSVIGDSTFIGTTFNFAFGQRN